MQIQAKIGGISYDRGEKPGTNYQDLELGKKFWNQVRVPGSDNKSIKLMSQGVRSDKQPRQSKLEWNRCCLTYANGALW